MQKKDFKILIIRFSSIGDIVLTTPVMRCIKQQLPNCTLHYCTKKSFEGLLNENPYVDKVLVLEDSLTSLIKTLRNEQYDYVIDLHHNLKTSIIKLFLSGKKKAFNKLNIQKFLYVNFKIDMLPNIHIVDRYMHTTLGLGVVNDNKGLDYFIPEKDIVEHDWIPASHRESYTAVVIGGQHYTKKLPISKLIELCHRINGPIILLGGKEDCKEANEIEAFFSKQYQDKLSGTIIFNAVGKFNLNQSASLLEQSSAVFTHDTGLMHIAAAFKKEIFSIWGNTSPKFGMYPYMTKFTVFENNNLSCRPCSKIGYNKCPKGHFKCMIDNKLDYYRYDEI